MLLTNTAANGDAVHGIHKYRLLVVLVVMVNRATLLMVVKLPNDVRKGGGTRMVRALQNA